MIAGMCYMMHRYYIFPLYYAKANFKLGSATTSMHTWGMTHLLNVIVLYHIFDNAYM
jgi:hypothetical protein